MVLQPENTAQATSHCHNISPYLEKLKCEVLSFEGSSPKIYNNLGNKAHLRKKLSRDYFLLEEMF